MIVIIPTYKRLDTLNLVIQSLFNCDLPDLIQKPRIAIVNNYPPNKQKVLSLIDSLNKVEGASEWKVLLKNRDKTLDPITNWYSAIEELAEKDEIVFLHGDDDLFCRNDIIDRYNALVEQNGDILVSPFYSGLTFLNSEKIQYDNPPMYKGKHLSNSVSINKEKYFTTPFISAQVFKKNENYSRAINLCYKWINSQNWAPYEHTSIMLPYYLPIAFNYINAKVVYSNQSHVIRGSSIKDKFEPFGIPGWNSGFISLFTLNILNNEDLRSISFLNEHREKTNRFINRYYFTFFFDRRIDKQLLKNTLEKIKFKKEFYFQLEGIKMIFADLFRITGLMVRLKSFFQYKVYYSKDLLKII